MKKKNKYPKPSDYDKEIYIYAQTNNGCPIFGDTSHPLSGKRGHVRYARHVMSLKLGFWIPKGTQIKYRDGDWGNCSFDNLETPTVFLTKSKLSKFLKRGDSPSQIAQQFNVTTFAVAKRMEKFKISHLNQHKNIDLLPHLNDIVKMVNDGETLISIANKYNVSDATIHRFLQKHNLKTKQSYTTTPPTKESLINDVYNGMFLSEMSLKYNTKSLDHHFKKLGLKKYSIIRSEAIVKSIKKNIDNIDIVMTTFGISMTTIEKNARENNIKLPKLYGLALAAKPLIDKETLIKLVTEENLNLTEIGNKIKSSISKVNRMFQHYGISIVKLRREAFKSKIKNLRLKGLNLEEIANQLNIPIRKVKYYEKS